VVQVVNLAQSDRYAAFVFGVLVTVLSPAPTPAAESGCERAGMIAMHGDDRV
jgi:hypothetical protein